MLHDSGSVVSDSAPDSARPMATGDFGETTAPDVLASLAGSEELLTPFRRELCGNSAMPIEVHLGSIQRIPHGWLWPLLTIPMAASGSGKVFGIGGEATFC